MSAKKTNIHKEIVLEDHLVQQLCDTLGYQELQPDDFDRKLALDTDVLIEFIQQTQEDEWGKLTAQYADSALKRGHFVLF